MTLGRAYSRAVLEQINCHFQCKGAVLMQYRTLGQSDLQVPTVIVGAWAMGGWCWGGTDEEESVRAIREAIDLGMNCVDTAPARTVSD